MTANELAETEPGWVAEVLQFWFAELTESQWFGAHPVLDARIREHYHALRERLLSNSAENADSARAALAAVVVLDQFSRNMFRNDPRAYDADPVARALARKAIEQGWDAVMSREERLFLYMPFQHSEDRADQALSVALAATLDNEGWLRFAQRHKAMIDRFGRFPHRNAILQRPSTAAEIEILRDPAASF